MPELPPERKCSHWATISKFLYGFLVRNTPVGFPVHDTTPSFQDQVSASQLTFTKSAFLSSVQPGPVASIYALGSALDSSADSSEQDIASVKNIKDTIPTIIVNNLTLCMVRYSRSNSLR